LSHVNTNALTAAVVVEWGNLAQMISEQRRAVIRGVKDTVRGLIVSVLQEAQGQENQENNGDARCNGRLTI
jgi:hypothetical protein